MISRRDGSCSYFEGEGQRALQTSAAGLDPAHDFLWAYEWRTHQMRCFNVIASSIRSSSNESTRYNFIITFFFTSSAL